MTTGIPKIKSGFWRSWDSLRKICLFLAKLKTLYYFKYKKYTYKENEIRSDIQLLAENYLPAAKRYEKATAKIDAMQADIDVIKSVIREHSEKLQKIS